MTEPQLLSEATLEEITSELKRRGHQYVMATFTAGDPEDCEVYAWHGNTLTLEALARRVHSELRETNDT